MLSSVAAFIRTSLNHRRAVKEIINLCNLMDLDYKKTKIWDELQNGNYNPIIPITTEEEVFENAFLRTAVREARIWGYLHYMTLMGDVNAEDVKARLKNFTFFESLTKMIGPENIEVMSVKKPSEWWDE